MQNRRRLLAAVFLPGPHSARTFKYGVTTSGLLAGASVLVALLRTYLWDRHLLPRVAVDDVVFDLALVIAAGLWFRLSWIMTPEQPTIRLRSAVNEVWTAFQWAVWLPAVVMSPLWVIIVFLEHGVFTQYTAVVNVVIDVLWPLTYFSSFGSQWYGLGASCASVRSC